MHQPVNQHQNQSQNHRHVDLVQDYKWNSVTYEKIHLKIQKLLQKINRIIKPQIVQKYLKKSQKISKRRYTQLSDFCNRLQEKVKIIAHREIKQILHQHQTFIACREYEYLLSRHKIFKKFKKGPMQTINPTNIQNDYQTQYLDAMIQHLKSYKAKLLAQMEENKEQENQQGNLIYEKNNQNLAYNNIFQRKKADKEIKI